MAHKNGFQISGVQRVTHFSKASSTVRKFNREGTLWASLPGGCRESGGGSSTLFVLEVSLGRFGNALKLVESWVGEEVNRHPHTLLHMVV